MAQVPVAAGLAHADIHQVGSGAHGAQQVRRVVGVVTRHRGAAPAAFKVRRKSLGTGLLRVAIDAAVGDVLGAAAHFWLAAIGISIYFLSLTIGGWLQGMAMLDASRPFMDSMTVTLPYLKGRTVGGALMVTGHLVFVIHFAWLLTGASKHRDAPTMLNFFSKA